jgi:hypothetical protein
MSRQVATPALTAGLATAAGGPVIDPSRVPPVSINRDVVIAVAAD